MIRAHRAALTPTAKSNFQLTRTLVGKAPRRVLADPRPSADWSGIEGGTIAGKYHPFSFSRWE